MYLFKYIVKRIIWGVLTTLIVLFISFYLIKLLKVPLPQSSTLAEIVLRQREALGYNKPIVIQFFIWLKAFFQGDLGYSIELSQGTEKVLDIIARALPPTIVVNLWTLALTIPFGIQFGIIAAIKKNKWQDHAINIGLMVFLTVPSFVMCFFIQYFVCFKLGLFPLQVYSKSVAGGLFTFKMFYSMIPAILSMALGSTAGLARRTRAELTDQINTDYMLLARAKGLSYRQAIFRHSLKNAMVPIFPSIVASFIGLLAGSFYVEQIFGIPGIGRLTIRSISALDYNVFMATEAFYLFLGMIANIIYDISYGIIDPRIKMGAR